MRAALPAVLCCAVLQDLLAKCGYVPGEDVVLSVGDLVNKARAAVGQASGRHSANSCN